MKEVFPLVRAANAGTAFLLSIGVILLAIIVLVVVIGPSGGRFSAPVLVPVAIVVLTAVGLYIFMVAAPARSRVEVTGGALKLKAPIYGRTIPVASLALDRSRVIDLTADKDYRPKLRTNGIGLPKFKEGWFVLRNNEKALVLLTESRRVLYLPTHDGYCVLVSAENPEALLAALKKAGSATEPAP